LDSRPVVTDEGNQTYEYTNATIKFDQYLDCESCIRGGYDFCIFRSFPSQTTHDLFTNCTDHEITPAINSITSVNETDRWVCSGAFKDEMNSIINMCYPDTEEHRNQDLCGDYLIDLNTDAWYQTETIYQMALNQSCTYRLHTTCGYPSVLFTSKNDITNEFDISWITQDNLTVNNDINTWNFNWTSSQFGNLNSSRALSFNNITQSGAAVEGATVQYCNGTDKNMWVTVTRIASNTPTVGRLLQAAPVLSNISLSFYSSQGETEPIVSFSSILTSSFAMFVCLISVFAF
jgi:hypothetical protein